MHDWFFQNEALAAIFAVVFVLLRAYTVAFVFAMAGIGALLFGVYACGRWRRGERVVYEALGARSD